MRTVKIPANKRIFGEGDSGDEAYRIIEGSVEISIGQGTDKVILEKIHSGEVFGEMGMIDGRARSATAKAVDEVQLEVISREDFHQSLAAGGDAFLPYHSAIFERLRITNERLHDTLKQLRGEAADDLASNSEYLVKQPHKGPSLSIAPDSDEMLAQSALQTRTIEAFPYQIGRRGELAAASLPVKNQMLIADRMPYRISRHHCTIERSRDGFIVRDRNSRRGTVVNGVLIGGKSNEKSLRLVSGENTMILGGSESACRFILHVGEVS